MDEDLGDIGTQKTLECPRCSPTVIVMNIGLSALSVQLSVERFRAGKGL
jgi:hypothetical protein